MSQQRVVNRGLFAMKYGWTSRVVILIALFMSCRDTTGWPTIYPVGTTIYDESKSYKGYTLFHCQADMVIHMIDMKGNVVHTWDDFGGRTPMHFEPIENGRLLVGVLDEDAGKNYVVEVDWHEKIIWEYKIEEGWLNQHDFQRMANGNTLMLLATTEILPAISPNPVKYDRFIEVTRSGEIVWQWNTCDHFSEFGFDEEALELIAERGGDWPHSNSYHTIPPNPNSGDPRFKPGNILISQRETNIIFIVDKDTGRIVWKVGPDDNMTIGQHCARMMPTGMPGAGNIVVLDNGGFAGYPIKTRLYSRIVEIDPVNKKLAWSYSAGDSNLDLISFFTAFMGSQERQPNGNTLICEAASGRLFEVTPSGENVWEYVNPFYTEPSDESPFPHNKIYKAYRVDSDWVPPGGLPVPGAGSPLEPVGAVGDNPPMFAWEEVESATSYYVWIERGTEPYYAEWFENQTSWTPDFEFEPGEYKWWVRTFSQSGYGPWSDSASFEVE